MPINLQHSTSFCCIALILTCGGHFIAFTATNLYWNGSVSKFDFVKQVGWAHDNMEYQSHEIDTVALSIKNITSQVLFELRNHVLL